MIATVTQTGAVITTNRMTRYPAIISKNANTGNARV
jgi:hypothetical protein